MYSRHSTFRVKSLVKLLDSNITRGKPKTQMLVELEPKIKLEPQTET